MSLRLIHLVSLGTVGGIQRDYCRFINTVIPDFPVEHHTLLTHSGISPSIEAEVRAGSTTVRHLRSLGRVRIPHWPRIFIDRHLRSIIDRIDPDAMVLWSNPRVLSGYRLPANVAVVYYEHGASWFNRGVESIRASLGGIDGVVCNSFASSRMVALKWRLPESVRISVCPNAIQMDACALGTTTRHLAKGQPIVLGVAGRLEPIKGFALAIHAVAQLAARGIKVKLLVAGVGPELEVLKTLTAALSIEQCVTFLGFVEDMSPFYSQIDIFLCPSIREPFGLVCAEAMAFGVPVICTQVDGLPEVVENNGSGVCLHPELPIEQYSEFGGRLQGIPDYVYDPLSDQIKPPKLLSPGAIADCVHDLIQAPERYQAMSRHAMMLVKDRFDYPEHARQVLAAIQSYCH